MSRLTFRVSALGFFLVLLALTMPLASAAALCPTGTFESILNAPNTSGYGTNFGSVCVDVTSASTATLTYIAASGFGFVDGSAADANVTGVTSATATTPGNIVTYTTSVNGACPPPVDGIGCYNVIANTQNASTLVGEIDIALTGNFAGLTDSTLLFANALGYDAAAHVAVLGSNCAGSPCTLFVGETTGTSSVPEPTSIALLGGAVVFMTNRLRKRFAS